MPTQEERKTLNERYRDAEEHLLGSRIEAALAELRIIDALEKIEQHKTKRTRRLAAITFVLLSMIVISLGVTIRLNSTAIDLTIKATGMELISSSKHAPVLMNAVVESAGVSIDDVEYFNNMPPKLYRQFEQFTQQPATGDISVEAKSVMLEELSLEPSEKSPTIVIDHRLGNVDIYVRDAKLSGLLVIKDATHLSTHRGDDEHSLLVDNAANDRIDRYFSTSEYGKGAIPHSIRFFDVRGLSVKVVELRSVRFSREYPPGSGNPQSTIVGGTLRLLEIGEEVQLRRGEYLWVECNDCTRNLINHDNDHFTLTLRGTITRLAGGYEKELKNYMPTLLAYLYYNEKVVMLWTATLFVLGLFWNVRKFA